MKKLYGGALVLLALTAFAQTEAPAPAPAVGAPPPVAAVRDLDQAREKVLQQEQKQRQILGALYKISVGIHSAVNEKSKLNKKKMSLETQVETLNKSIGMLDQRTAALQTRLGERLRAIHRLGGHSVMQILFSAQSSSVVDRNLRILGLIAKKDRDAVKEYMAVKREQQSKKSKLDGRLAELGRVEGQIKVKEQSLLKEQLVKNKILSGVKKKKLFAESSLRQLKTKLRSSDDDGVLDALYAPSFADRRGQLSAPVKGRIARSFGLQKGVDHPWVINHKGVLFAAAERQDVKTVFPGTVAWVGQVQEWGSTVIVDHGDHYYTVYSGVEKVLVEPGCALAEGQTLAKVETASRARPSEIYFEVRHFSEPDDPQQWLKGTTL